MLASWLDNEVRPFSPFWRTRLADRTVSTIDELSEVPVTIEADVAGAGGPGNPDLLVLPTEEGFRRHATRAELIAAAREVGRGGAEGRRDALFRRYKPVHVHEAGVGTLLAVAYTRSDLDRLHLAGARLSEVLGLGADDMVVNAVPAGPSIRFWGLYHAALAARMTALHPRGAGQAALRPVLRALALAPATVLAVPVHEASDVLADVAERGVTVPTLRTLVTVGPPPRAPLRTQLVAAAERLAGGPVRVQAVWAPETSRVLWGECRPATADPGEATYGLHTYPDLEVVEVRDVLADTDAQEGADGEVVLTSLGWRGTAFVRLATGAWTGGLETAAPCPSCGRTVPRLAPQAVDAAWQPRVRGAHGRFVRADLRGVHQALTPQIADRLAVRTWALRAEGDRLVLAVDADTDASMLQQLAVHVGGAVGAPVDVRVDPGLAATRPQVGAGDATR